MFIRIGTSILGIYSEVSYSPECRIGGINFLKIIIRFLFVLFGTYSTNPLPYSTYVSTVSEGKVFLKFGPDREKNANQI